MIVYFSGYTRTKRHSTAIAFLLALSLSFFVAAMTFWVMRPKMAHDFRDSSLHLYLFLFAAILLVWCMYIVFAKRIKIEISQNENDGSLLIEVFDKSLTTPIRVQSPLSYTKHWASVDLGRRNKIKELYISVNDGNDEPVLRLTGGLGNFYDAPDGFQSIPNKQILPSCPNAYDCGKIQDIAHALWCYEDYLALKNKSKTPRS